MRHPTRRTDRTRGRSRVSRCTRDRFACGLRIRTAREMRNREEWIFFSSHFVVGDARGLLFVVGDVDLEIGKQRTSFALQQSQTRDRHATDLELRALAAA